MTVAVGCTGTRWFREDSLNPLRMSGEEFGDGGLGSRFAEDVFDEDRCGRIRELTFEVVGGLRMRGIIVG